MNIEVIYPPDPDEVIPDREADRLFQDLMWRGDNGEFDPLNTELITDDDLAEISDAFWDIWIGD